jgi:hypothetical protein
MASSCLAGPLPPPLPPRLVRPPLVAGAAWSLLKRGIAFCGVPVDVEPDASGDDSAGGWMMLRMGRAPRANDDPGGAKADPGWARAAPG